MARKASRTSFGSKGFTIVELLIVVVVIAILASITVVAYNGITARTHDATVKADLSNLMKKFELWKVDHGAYPASTVEGSNILADLNFSASSGSYAVSPTTVNNLVYCYDLSDRTRTYAVAALSKSGQAYYISPRDSTVQDFPNEWGESAGEDADICTGLGDGLTRAYRGYASNDGSGDIWRDWTGVPD